MPDVSQPSSISPEASAAGRALRARVVRVARDPVKCRKAALIRWKKQRLRERLSKIKTL